MNLVEPADDSQIARSLPTAFLEAYGAKPAFVGRAPGRVNLIGEHTDYNAGLCLPLALPHATYAAVAPRADGVVRARSVQSEEGFEGRELAPGRVAGWPAYVTGVIWALREAGYDVPGVDVLVDGRVPLGAGLSSSAALECAVAVALAGLVGGVPPEAMVAAGIRAENEAVGAPTGGMDQTVSVFARAGYALLIDFDGGPRTQVPWRPEETDLTLLVVDTRVSHQLADGGYAARRADCVAAAAELGVPSLRHAKHVERLPYNLQRRARHVVSEIGRVELATSALAVDDWPEVGRLFTESHASLRDDFEVSCAELDVAVDAALAAGALGARMTGGGFGGCAIALLPTDLVDTARKTVDAAFAERGWREPAYLLAVASAGAGV
ncbi:galactokinase [Nocardioides speluncae]|uniref:galactokinase n=1 Tax=Nocardioides speluncae TaxID=2670337 RepID=UPI000D68FB47|nr:galactokinase [Nocardioides speluncae]